MTLKVVVCDFDLTLSPHYMQKALFDYYGIDEAAFWEHCKRGALNDIRYYGDYNGSLVWMRQLSRLAGTVSPAITNTKLAFLGKSIELFPGVEEWLDSLYEQKVPVFVVTAGSAIMLEFLKTRHHVQQVWGCHFLEEEGQIASPAYIVTEKDKPRCLEAILAQQGADPRDLIYIGDGESDEAAFRWTIQHGGTTIGVAPDSPLMEQWVEDGTLTVHLKPDYQVYSPLYNFVQNLCTKTRKLSSKR